MVSTPLKLPGIYIATKGAIGHVPQFPLGVAVCGVVGTINMVDGVHGLVLQGVVLGVWTRVAL